MFDRRGESQKVLANEEKLQEFRIGAGRQHEPGRGDRREQRQPPAKIQPAQQHPISLPREVRE